MPTTADYLNDLVAQKNALAAALTEAGVEVEDGETFSTLVPKANEKIAMSGGEDSLSACLNKTITSYKSDSVTAILYRMFDGCAELEEVELTALETFDGTYTFRGCTKLTSVELPNLKTLGNNPTSGSATDTFGGCSSLKTLRLPNWETVNWKPNQGYIFRNCSSLTELYIPKLQRLGSYFFSGCTSLKIVDAPGATDVVNWVLFGSSIETLSIPNVTTLSADNGFTYGKIQTLDLPSLVLIKSNKNFMNCASLTTLTFGQDRHTVLEMYMCTTQFQGCKALSNVTMNCTLKRYGGTTLSFAQSPLTLESAKSIISALYDYSDTDEELAYTVSFAPSTLSLLEAEGATAPGEVTWLEYAYNKGWNY